MEAIRNALLLIHIITGGIALLTGPVAMFNQNGNRLHRITGKIFFFSMTIVFISSIYLAIYNNTPFLLMIAVFSYHSIAMGYRALYLKKLNTGIKALPLDWMITIGAAIFNTALLLWGANYYFLEHQTFGVVALLFGSFGLLTNYNAVKRYLNGYKTKNGWLFVHIAGMIGGYIATTTAFLVNVVTFQPSFVLWLAPSIVFTPIIFYSIRKFQLKFDKGKEIGEIATVSIQ